MGGPVVGVPLDDVVVEVLVLAVLACGVFVCPLRGVLTVQSVVCFFKNILFF